MASHRPWRIAVLMAVLACASDLALAREAPPMADDPVLESRVLAVAEELRCLVCQNETLAASQAELARDLRAQIRTQLAQGQRPEQVRDFMVARYGDFVLYRPPFRPATALLWAGPFALLALALAWLVRRVRRRPIAKPLSSDEVHRVQHLLDPEAR